MVAERLLPWTYLMQIIVHLLFIRSDMWVDWDGRFSFSPIWQWDTQTQKKDTDQDSQGKLYLQHLILQTFPQGHVLSIDMCHHLKVTLISFARLALAYFNWSMGFLLVVNSVKGIIYVGYLEYFISLSLFFFYSPITLSTNFIILISSFFR